VTAGNRLKIICKVLGIICLCGWIATSLALLFYYWQTLTHWFGGFIGTILVFLTSPGVLVFPLIYWFVQGAFPVFYFELLGLCLLTGIGGVALLSMGD
jgi:hypothetical protein